MLFASLFCCGDVDDGYLKNAHGKTMKEFCGENQTFEASVRCDKCGEKTTLLVGWDLCPECKGDGYV